MIFENPSYAGYRVEAIYAYEQHCERVVLDEAEAKRSTRNPTVYWTWYPGSGKEFFVFLGIAVPPSEERPEDIRVAVIGSFAVEANNPDIPFHIFARQEASAILIPHIAALMRNLTAAGLYGAYELPEIDLDEVLREQPFEKSPGTDSVREEPKVGEALGIDPDVIKRRSAPHSKPRARATKPG